ncbi:MAG: PEP-CTERM sorting domain-containing protein [Desulfobulbaceae bacterium]|nr:PEP-CTERM sorting domain-containing protein [Desulfobulbaceae bacterium]
MMKKRLLVSLATCLLLVVNSAHALPLNLDFGTSGGPPSAGFGAASGQTGTWNNITQFSTISGIVDIYSNTTSVAVSITANQMDGSTSLPDGNANDLMEDNFFSYSPNSWSISITGLTNGMYDVYLYEPHNSRIGTGSGSLNGNAFTNINGNFGSGSFVQGSNYYLFSNVAVTGGTLTATGSQTIGYSGLSGMQIVSDQQGPGPAPVPEPATMFLFGTGLAGLIGSRLRKKKSA